MVLSTNLHFAKTAYYNDIKFHFPGLTLHKMSKKLLGYSYVGCFLALLVCIILLKLDHQKELQLTAHHPHLSHFTTNSTLPHMDQYASFKKFLSLWPKNKPKAAIYFLTTTKRLSKLQTALMSLDKYLNDHFHYPVIIFHEENTRKHLMDITSWSKSYIVCQEISFKLPSFIPSNYKYKTCTSYSRGYRHMCRFHSKLLYEQPVMRLLDYAWRLDDDSELLYPIDFDVFQFMHQNDIEYGYQLVTRDSEKCVVGLWDTARHYVIDNNITTQLFHQWWDTLVFYNNFELSKVSFWLSKQYQDYMEYIDQLGGIYYKRWGDAPTKSIAISMFMPRRKIYNFNCISYKHQDFQNNAKPPCVPHSLKFIEQFEGLS